MHLRSQQLTDKVDGKRVEIQVPIYFTIESFNLKINILNDQNMFVVLTVEIP